jgi:4-hydroxymandelate oxidase
MNDPEAPIALDLDDLQEIARPLLETSAFDYFAGGSGTESTLRDNVDAWRRIRLRPRVFRDVTSVDLSTTVMGTTVSMPVLLAPVAYHGMAHEHAEIATASAAALADTIMVVSTLANVALEDIATATPGGSKWFQLYVHVDRELTRSLVQRAESSGYEAIVITVDTPKLGQRRRDERNRFALPPNLRIANIAGRPTAADPSEIANYASSAFASVTLEDIEWLRSITSLPIAIKGVLRPDDAQACLAVGAQAVIVSNHGGRQLDGAVATADVLAEVSDAVGDAGEVLVDGGIRSGTDVVRALALGARAVLIGRPQVWGLAIDGAAGVRTVLETLRTETTLAFQLAGARTNAEITSDLIWAPSSR